MVTITTDLMRTKLILHIIFFVQICTLLMAREWEIVSTMPYPVKGAQAVVQDSVIYIVGGFSDSVLAGTRQIQAYYPRSNRWEVVENQLTIPRYGHNIQKYNNQAYIFGGSSVSNDSAYALENWDFSLSPFIEMYEPNFNRKFATSVLDGDYIYLMGGYPDFQLFDSLKYFMRFHIPSGSYSDSFEVNNLYADELPSLQMSAISDNLIYIIGGAYNGILRDIRIFDIQASNWTDKTYALNQPRAGGTALLIPDTNQIVIIGGFNESNSALANVEIFDLTYNVIHSGPSLQFARSECAAAVFDAKIYVFGGVDMDDKIIAEVEMNDAFLEGSATNLSDHSQHYTITDFEQLKNYPNPFNPDTRIEFKLNKPVTISVDIYDLNGKLVKHLLTDYLSAGWQRVRWDGTDSNRLPVSSGIFFYQVKSKNYSQTERMLLIR